MQMFLEPCLGFLFIGGLLSGSIALVTTIFWLWMLIDAITNTALTGTEKIIWVLVVLLSHIIGALLYFLLARGGRVNRPGI